MVLYKVCLRQFPLRNALLCAENRLSRPRQNRCCGSDHPLCVRGRIPVNGISAACDMRHRRMELAMSKFSEKVTQDFLNRLQTQFNVSPDEASDKQIYLAL